SENFYTLSNELSIKGMRITCDKKFPENTEIELKILLEFDEEPIKLKAKVAWQKKVFLGNYIIGLEFIKISKEDILKIKRLID
ncbi:MAG: PilZ domain-containing protein, partial [Armatimonadetes bacterium]|nr:PilZ domain-containing protein [Armatimonadota bacterium]